MSLSNGKESKEAEEESPTAPGPEALLLPMEGSLLADTVRVSTAKLDSLLRQAEELMSAKLTARQRGSDFQKFKATIGTWEKEWASINLDVRAIQHSLERNGGGTDPENRIRILITSLSLWIGIVR